MKSWQPLLHRRLWRQLLGLHLWLQHSCSLGIPRYLPWFPIWACQAEIKVGDMPDFHVQKSPVGCHLLIDRRCRAAKIGSSHSSKMKLEGLFWTSLFWLKSDNLFFFMGSLMGVVCSTNGSVMKVWYCSWPIVSAWRTEDATVGSTMSLVSSLRKSVVSSNNGQPISSMTSTSYLTCFPKSSGNSWTAHGGLLCFLSRDASNSLVIFKSSGPTTIQRLKPRGIE